MNVLKKKNGLALIAVMVLLMILTLFVPAMLTYADTATSSAIKGTTKQKAAYLARTGVEMAVATFMKTYDDGDANVETAYEALYRRLGGKLKSGETALSELNAETIYLFIDKDAPVPTVGPNGETEVFSEDYYASVYTTDYDAYINNTRYKYGGKVDVKITRRDEVHVYKVMSNGYSYDICCNPDYAADFAAACNNNVNNPIQASGTDAYSYVKQKYAQYDFTGTSEVNGVKISRKASALDTVNTKDSAWTGSEASAVYYENGVRKIRQSGIEMVTVNPDNASSKQTVTYTDGTAPKNKKNIDALIYSAYGNVIIDSDATYPSRSELKNLAGIDLSSGDYNTMVSTLPIYFGCLPGINYYKEEKDGILGHVQCVTLRNNTDHSIVAFTATNAIQVNMPVNVTTNPIRTDSDQPDQGTVYKMMAFQANDIVFEENIVNFAMFTWNNNDLFDKERGKRYGSVILAATESTPYSYYNISRQKMVKAGKVTFLEDVYLVYIEYGDNSGKSVALSDEVYGNWSRKIYTEATGIENQKARYNIISSTEVKHIFPVSSNFGIKNYVGVTKYGYHVTKLFNAGDVYYFNAEIEANMSNGSKQKVGLNMMGWWAESYYLKEKDLGGNKSKILNWFVSALYYAFGITYDPSNLTYRYDDMHYVGNVYDALPPPADLATVCYIVWDS